MTLEAGYNDRIPEAPLQYQETADDTDDPILRTPLQVRDSIIGTISNPPVIVEARFKKKRKKNPITIEIRDCPNNPEKLDKPTDLTIFIPIEGNQLGHLYSKTGCSSLDEMINKLQDIAIDCGLGFLCAVDKADKQMIVNIHKVQGARYNKIMSRDQVTFINCFYSVLA